MAYSPRSGFSGSAPSAPAAAAASAALALGGAVAVVDLLDCRPFVRADDAASGMVWSRFPDSREGHYAWVLRLVRRVSSGVIKGRLGFYDVPESVLVG